MKKTFFLLFACSVFAGASFPVAAQEARSSGSATYLETRLTQQENDMRVLNGRFEQLEFSIRRLEQALQRLQSDVDMRVSHLEQVVQQEQTSTAAASAVAAQAAAASAQTQPQDQTPALPVADMNGTLGALKMQGGKVTGGVNKPQSPALPSVPADYGLTSQEQYERAFNYLREANYADAEEAFKLFIEKNPKDKLLDNAKYWYGETLYVRGRFDESAVAFADAYQQNPKGAKAPDSLLKLGLSLSSLNKTSDACVTFAELKSKYPKAAPAIKSRADTERTKLKCPAK